MEKHDLSKIVKFIYIFLFCGLGCLSCLFLQTKFQLPSYFSSAIVGLLGSFLPELKTFDRDIAISSIYTGSFASMSSLTLFASSQDIMILCFLTGAYNIILAPYFKGLGGKLGTIGFLSSLSFILIKGAS